MFTWRPWILKCLEIHNCIASRNWYHISPIWQFFRQAGEEIANWCDSQWRQNTVTTVEHAWDRVKLLLGSITSRCSGNEPVLLPQRHERSAEIEPKLLQSPYLFRLPCPPLPLPTDILYPPPPQFSSHQETKMAARGTQRSTSTISQKTRSVKMWKAADSTGKRAKYERANTLIACVADEAKPQYSPGV